MPLSSAYPSAAEFDESGTEMTQSASIGCSRASWRPKALRARSTLTPHSRESGRAKYTSSKMQGDGRGAGRRLRSRSTRFPLMRSTSPGSTSRRKVAPMMSRAQVSEATMVASPIRPRTRGRNPRGSRTAYSVSPTLRTSEKAPSTWLRASSICPSTVSWRERAMRCTRTSVSLEVWKMDPSETSRALSSWALVRFPLWAMESSPSA